MEMEQEETQFLGFFGIYKETYKLISTWKKIFTQITFSLILPLTLIFLAHFPISDALIERIWIDAFTLRDTQQGTSQYENLSNLVRSEQIKFNIFRATYFTFVLAFSLLSTSAVVYKVACVYTSREITFKNVINVVPRVWKRLIVTFVCAFLAFSVYNMALGLALYVRNATMDHENTSFDVVSVIIMVCYALGFVYLGLVWQLASVVSVMEESYGFKAMVKSVGLIKGKLCLAVAVFVKLIVCLLFLYYGFMVCSEMGNFKKFVGVLGFMMLFMIMALFGLVVQTVIYFVCKSYHYENIDKSKLSEHLEAFLGDYVALKDVQMEEFDL